MLDIVAHIAAKLLAAPLTARGGRSSATHAVVVLGAPVGAGPRLSPVLEERVGAAAELYRNGLADLVCVTGTEAEAKAMVERALALGVARPDLVIDASARSTFDNAANVAELLRERGRRTAWVATQPFHSRRACFWFRYFGIIPLSFRMDDSLQYRDPRRALKWSLREYASWAKLVARFVIRRDRR